MGLYDDDYWDSMYPCSGYAGEVPRTKSPPRSKDEEEYTIVSRDKFGYPVDELGSPLKGSTVEDLYSVGSYKHKICEDCGFGHLTVRVYSALLGAQCYSCYYNNAKLARSAATRGAPTGTALWDQLFTEALIGKSKLVSRTPIRRVEVPREPETPKPKPKPVEPVVKDRLYWVMKEIESGANETVLCPDCGTARQVDNKCCAAEIKRLKRKQA